MRNIYILLLGLFLFSFFNICYSQKVDSLYEVGTWQGFRQGAVSYTFDDGCANQFTVAIPLFNQYDFKLTLFTVTSWGPNWSNLQAAADSGHEVANHTVNHGHLGTLTRDQLNTEFKSSQALINSRVKGQTSLTMAYPYCETAIDSICEKYFIAARICSNVIESKTPPDFMKISSFICGDQGQIKTSTDFNNKANSAAAAKGWVVYLIHGIINDKGVSDGGYSPVSSANLRGSIEYLDKNRDRIWVNTFGNVARYIKERNCTSVKEISANDSLITFDVTDTLDNLIYNFPITIRREYPQGWDTLEVTQNGRRIDYQTVEVNSTKYLMLDVVPDSGNVEIAKLGSITGVNTHNSRKPLSPYLMQNYPNPFNPVTRIDYQVSETGLVSIKVFDVLGREVKTLVNNVLSSGKYSVNFDARNLPSGLYFYTLTAGNYSSSRKLVLLK